MSHLPLPYSDSWCLSEQTTAEGKRYIRVPIAVLGEWDHPSYGKVTFSQDDFNDMQQNWKQGVTGYEPPLFLGHPISKDVMEGDPAVAFLESLYQEGDVLFGQYDPVDDEAFDKTRKGHYRYSSAEVVRNATSKETGKKVGTLLVGAALTNRPFLTRMPRVEAGVQQFSEPEGTAHTLFAVSVYPDPASDMDKEKVETAPQVSPELVEQFAELVKEVETMRAELEQHKVLLSEANKTLAAQALEKKLAEVATLNLTAVVKEKYSSMLSAQTLSEDQQSEIMSLLRQLSDENKEVFTEAKGDLSAEVGKVDSAPVVENPYKEQIERNMRFAEERAKQALV